MWIDAGRKKGWGITKKTAWHGNEKEQRRKLPRKRDLVKSIIKFNFKTLFRTKITHINKK